MAFIQMNLLSKSLMRTVPVNVILPVDKMAHPGMPQREAPANCLALVDTAPPSAIGARRNPPPTRTQTPTTPTGSGSWTLATRIPAVWREQGLSVRYAGKCH